MITIQSQNVFVLYRVYKDIRPLTDDTYLVYLKSRMRLFCTNFLHCEQCCQADKSYCHFKNFCVTLVFIHTTSDVHTHSLPPLIPWPSSVRQRMKINVTVKFLKWQRDLSVWLINSLATLFTVYKIRTQQPIRDFR